MRMLTRALAVLLVAGLSATAQQAPSLDEALQKIANYKFGESREALTVVNDLVRKADNSGNADERKATEEKLLALLKTNPSPDCVDFICRQIAIIGSEAAVPVFAPMLTKDEQGTDWARYALEGIAGKAVDDAFLDALTKVNGRARVGLINSLGIRKTQAAVSVLGTLTGDKDEPVASAALASLGLIGGDEATISSRKPARTFPRN